jgi:hypothetical protein
MGKMKFLEPHLIWYDVVGVPLRSAEPTIAPATAALTG